MRRISFSKILAGVVIMAGLSNHSVEAVNQISHYLQYYDTPVIGTDTLGGVNYSTFSYGDLFNGGGPGKPSLPVDYIRFSVPYNATNFSVTVTWRMNVTYNLDHLLYPCQAPRWMNDTTPVTVTLPDSATYYSGESYPSQRAWVVDDGYLEGENHIVTVAVMPFSYSHSESSDVVSLRKTGILRLSYELSDSLDIYPIVRKDSALREEGYRLAQSMVVNPNQVASFSLSYNPIGTGVGPIGPINPNGGLSGNGVNGGSSPILPNDTLTQVPDYVDPNPGLNYDMNSKFPYLIVTTNELYHPLRRLAALKRQKGYNVKIVTMDQVMSDAYAKDGDYVIKPDSTYQVAYNDSAGVLRQFLKGCFWRNGTKYVLLVGSSIPYRHINQELADPVFENGHLVDTVFSTMDCVSDFYYIELDSDWSNSIKDHYPELFVGRLLCHQPEQIDNYIDKLLRYELNPGKGDYSYLRRMLFEEGQSFPTALTGFKDSISSIFPLDQAIELKESTALLRPKGKEVIDTLNANPVGLINIFNHGDTTRISVYADSRGLYNFIHSIRSEVKGNGLNCLSNRDYPMIFLSPSCSTVPFDNSTGVNMGESFTIGKDYGGPVYMGFTRNIRTTQASAYARLFAKWLKDGYHFLGMADALSVHDVYIDKNAIMDIFTKQDISIIHAYLGDPSLELWTDLPHQFGSVNISRSDSSVVISGIDADSTIVSYYDNDGNIKRAMLTTNSVTLSASPNESIMLHKHNYIPYIAPLFMQNISVNKSKYVLANDVAIGSSIDGSRTNGDVVIKRGVNYEIEASGTTSLYGGFSVESGASFSVIPSVF